MAYVVKGDAVAGYADDAGCGTNAPGTGEAEGAGCEGYAVAGE